MRRIEYEDKEYLIFTRSGMSLLDAAREREVPVVCNCTKDESDGKCAIKFPIENQFLLTAPTALEKKTLSAAKMKNGWRLGCQALYK